MLEKIRKNLEISFSHIVYMAKDEGLVTDIESRVSDGKYEYKKLKVNSYYLKGYEGRKRFIWVKLGKKLYIINPSHIFTLRNQDMLKRGTVLITLDIKKEVSEDGNISYVSILGDSYGWY